MNENFQKMFGIVGMCVIVHEIGQMGLREQNQAIAALVCVVGMLVYFRPSREVSEKRCVSIFGSENGE